MSDTIIIPVAGDIDALLRQARQAAKAAGGKLAGDSKAGTFTGKTPVGAIKGAYSVTGQTITVTISEKPWLVPLGRIDKELREYFA
jgi:hypothetical protein